MMTRIPLTFSEAKAVADRMWVQSSASSAKLNLYPRGAMGLTLDSVRATIQWNADKSEADRDFRALQDWNKVYVKQFKKEIQTARAAKYAEMTMVKS